MTRLLAAASGAELVTAGRAGQAVAVDALMTGGRNALNMNVELQVSIYYQ